MASSFIEFKNYGFWAKDGFIEAMQNCLIDEIEVSNFDSSSWIIEYKEELALQSLPLIFGGMCMRLDEFLIDEDRKRIIINLIDQINEKINANDVYISNNNLNKMRRNAMMILFKNGNAFNNISEVDDDIKKSRWRGNTCVSIYKDRYINAFLLLKKLIAGELKTDTSSLEDYWNYKSKI